MSFLSRLSLRLFRPALAKAIKSVVYIETYLGNNMKAGGTGFVIADDVICTCKHVLKGAAKIIVHTADGRKIDVSNNIINLGIVADMALIDIPDLGLAPLEIDPELPDVNGDRRVFVPSMTRKGLRMTKGRMSFRDTDELIFVSPNLGSITQQKELALIVKPSKQGDSGSPVLTRDGKVRLMVNAYSESAIIKFKDVKSDRALIMMYVTFCARMDSVLRDAEALGLTE
ncbi:MAG: hypothetical protein CMF62_08890 [Magnetococcales bacterium]|nr:hypothetical protein [Magnetococcales bacterium]